VNSSGSMMGPTQLMVRFDALGSIQDGIGSETETTRERNESHWMTARNELMLLDDKFAHLMPEA
jgi:hypothetical protein